MIYVVEYLMVLNYLYIINQPYYGNVICIGGGSRNTVHLSVYCAFTRISSHVITNSSGNLLGLPNIHGYGTQNSMLIGNFSMPTRNNILYWAGLPRLRRHFMICLMINVILETGTLKVD